jgi:glycerol-3-phosphate dehydrogenase
MQVLVVGAGVVGLAVARTAALRGHDVIVAEAGVVARRTSRVKKRRLSKAC